MYGDPFGKSLCHAWAASPIYLLARYFVGLQGTEPGGARCELQPQTAFFQKLHCSFPMGDKLLQIDWEQGQLHVLEA